MTLRNSSAASEERPARCEHVAGHVPDAELPGIGLVAAAGEAAEQPERLVVAAQVGQGGRAHDGGLGPRLVTQARPNGLHRNGNGLVGHAESTVRVRDQVVLVEPPRHAAVRLELAERVSVPAGRGRGPRRRAPARPPSAGRAASRRRRHRRRRRRGRAAADRGRARRLRWPPPAWPLGWRRGSPRSGDRAVPGGRRLRRAGRSRATSADGRRTARSGGIVPSRVGNRDG